MPNHEDPDEEIVDAILGALAEAQADPALRSQMAHALHDPSANGAGDTENSDDLESPAADELPPAEEPGTPPPKRKRARTSRPAPVGPSFAWSATTELWETGFETIEAARTAARNAGNTEAWIGYTTPMTPDPDSIALDLLDALGYANLVITDKQRRRLGEIVIKAVATRIGAPVRVEIRTLAQLAGDAPKDLDELHGRIERGDYRGRNALVAADLARLVPHPAEGLLHALEQLGVQRVIETFRKMQPREEPKPDPENTASLATAPPNALLQG